MAQNKHDSPNLVTLPDTDLARALAAHPRSPHAIVVVPTKAGAPLLTEGMYGGLPPRVGVDSYNGRWSSQPRRVPALNEWSSCPGCLQWMPRNHSEYLEHLDGCPELVRLSALPFALPLVWEGVPVPDGIFRAWSVWGPDEHREEFEATAWTTHDVLADALDRVSAAAWLAQSLEGAGLCHTVLLDFVGGALVERTNKN